jgi:hypothetical protein
VADPSPDELDALFTVPPAEFVATRDRIAKQLRDTGEADAARDVRSLRRPTTAVWAANQAVRRRPDLVAALLAAGDGLRDAAERPTAEQAGDLRALTRQRRAALDALTGVALDAAGGVAPAGGALRDAVEATLDGAALEGDARPQFLAGRLTGAVERPVGFGVVTPGGEDPAARPPGRAAASRVRAPAPDRAPRVMPDELARRRARAALAEARDAADRAASAEHEAGVSLEAAASELDAATGEVARVETELESTRARARAARANLTDERRRHDAAVAARKRADAAVVRAQDRASE